MSETEFPSMEGLLPSIKVYPFPSLLNAHMDSILKAEETGLRISYRMALIECPKCLALDNFYNTKKGFKLEAHYCKGNLNPEFKCNEGHTHETHCAGIIQEHFHIHCLVCHFISFLAVPEKVG